MDITHKQHANFVQDLMPVRTIFPSRCHGAHTREEQGHADEDVNSNNSI